MSNFIKITEVHETGGNFKFSQHEEASTRTRISAGYSLRKVIINADHIITLKEETNYERMLQAETLVEGLDPRQKFTKIQLAGDASRFNSYVIVVGDIASIVKKIQNF